MRRADRLFDIIQVLRSAARPVTAAAERVRAKVTVMLPQALRTHLAEPSFYVSPGSAQPAEGVDLAAVRRAIRATRKIDIAYMDEQGNRTRRIIWPIAMAYYVDVT